MGWTSDGKFERPFTLQEAADILKIHRNTLQRMLKAGKIKAVKIGTVWRIRGEDIDRFLAGE